MKGRRTHSSNAVYALEGGTEDNDLWVTAYPADAQSGPCLGSTREPTPGERAAIAAGANIELVIWGTQHPPVHVRLSPHAVGKPPPSHDDDQASPTLPGPHA